MGLVLSLLLIAIGIFAFLSIISFALGCVLFGAIERVERRHRPPF